MQQVFYLYSPSIATFIVTLVRHGTGENGALCKFVLLVVLLFCLWILRVVLLFRAI